MFKRSMLCIGIAGIGVAIAACSEGSFNVSLPKTAEVAAQAETKGYRQTRVVEGINRPWGMAWLPDGSLLITEKGGKLRGVKDGKLQPDSISGVPPVMSEGQGGLMDVSIHPRFAENRFIYLTYSHGTPDSNRTRVARAVLDGKALRDLKVIFEVSQAKSGNQHFGSRIAWLPDNTMLVAIGDGGNPPVSLEGDLIRKQAQNLRSHLGKIVRLNDDGSIPKDNPLVGKANADPAIWSYGHRNIQGLTVDPIAKRVWSTEHGSKGGDELNLVEAGKNYGWPVVTHSKEYWGDEITQERSRPGMVDPKIVWPSTVAPGGLLFYTSDRVPAWKGNLFAAGMVSKELRQIKLDANGNIQSDKSISIGQRVRDVAQGPDGLVYILTDDGWLTRIEPE